MIGRLAVAYFGGALGGLLNSFVVWLLARADLIAAIGVRIAPPRSLDWDWLGPRILWGSLWGLGYPLVARGGLRPVQAGLLLSLAPSAAQLFYFFPRAEHGLLGLSLGALTPLVVLAANALWGWVLARTVIAAGRR